MSYTGGLTEHELFSSVEKNRSIPNLEMYLPYKRAKNIVKESQPYEDPSDPDPRFANDLHATIAERLNLDDYSKLRLFTAVKSHFDQYHGVDAFFEFDSQSGRVVIKLDVTTNPSKGEYIKNDDIIVFHYPSDGLDPKIQEDKEAYEGKLNEVSQSVINMINQKIERKEYEH